jgi:beta-phosphoglucomutase-like phosphatase (HAD superfamily)
MLRALIFDLDGTLIDTAAAHRAAFNAAFREFGLPWFWDDVSYRRLSGIAGDRERMAAYWHYLDPARAGTEYAHNVLAHLQAVKTRIYDAYLEGGRLPLRTGMLRMLCEASGLGLRLAVTSDSAPAHVDALMGGAIGSDWRERFACVADAASVPMRKPDPAAYREVLDTLGIAAGECLAFEDCANGLAAARAAGISTIVTTTACTVTQNFDAALRVLPHLGDPGRLLPMTMPGMMRPWVDVPALRQWHQRGELAGRSKLPSEA